MTTTDGEVIFEELPSGGHGGRPLGGWKLALMARPGEWARVPLAYKSAAATQLRSPDFEIVNRTVDGEKRVYARYIGENAS